jgi:thiamine phosphate synthase YjbQ (UPF0047 family)
MYVLKVRSRQRKKLVDFTDDVQKKLKESGAEEGLVVLLSPSVLVDSQIQNSLAAG